jgi:hypothetical protein
MGVKLFLHELYPSPLTGDKQSTSKQGQKKQTKGKTSHSQLIPHLIILLTHILKQHYISGPPPTHSIRAYSYSLAKKIEYKSSRGILKANIGTEPPGMVVTSSATQFASPPQTSTASPSATPPPATSVEATVEAIMISGNSTQNLPRQSPKNAEIAAATTETFTAPPSSD